MEEMDGFNWDNTNAVIGELIPLPPCLRSNVSGDFANSTECYANIDEEFGFGESLSHALLDLHKLEPSNGNLKTEAIDSKHLSKHQESRLVTRNENNLSPQSYQANMINPSQQQTFLAPGSSQRSRRFEIVFENKSQPKKPKLENSIKSANISFGHKRSSGWELDEDAMAEVKEMVYMQAAMRPVNLGLDEPVLEKPKRKNARVSSDPQTVAARHRRERISERLRVLQKLVPGGTKLDTASMLDEAASYVKFLQSLVRNLENLDPTVGNMISATSNPMDATLPLPQTKP